MKKLILGGADRVLLAAAVDAVVHGRKKTDAA